jgi:hypothetical protein
MRRGLGRSGMEGVWERSQWSVLNLRRVEAKLAEYATDYGGTGL